MMDEMFWLEEWFVQPRLGRIVRGQVVVHVRPRVMSVLLALAGQPGEVVSKRELVDVVWTSGFVSDNTITHCIRELRGNLGDSASSPRFVQTIPRRGYRLVGRVRPTRSTDTGSRAEEARFLLVAKRWYVYLVNGENLIGRGVGVQIDIESSRISRHHARIIANDRGAMIEDLDSKNGTFVGLRKIHKPTSIAHGDVVRIGDIQFEFHDRESDGGRATLTL